jgi:hypothetical protein
LTLHRAIVKADVGAHVLGEALSNLRNSELISAEGRARIDRLRNEIIAVRDGIIVNLERAIADPG